MEIVIDIPIETYKKYMDDRTHATDILHAVRHGIPLPEHHGRLIDADFVSKNASSIRTMIDVNNAPTIIEGSDSV